MKILSVVLLLLASMAFVLVGCSDDSAVPMTPTDKSSQAPIALDKAVITDFTFTHHPIPPVIIDPGVTRQEGENWIMKDVGVIEQVFSDDPLIAGTMRHYLSATMKAATGEGPVHGRGVITPTVSAGGGVWEMTYEGYRSYKETIQDMRYYTLPLKVVVHGRGGTINGIQGFFTTTITAWGTPPAGWYGGGNGFYKSH